MSNFSLSEFVGKIRAKNRISFGDVQRIQRNVLPDGIGSREEAELLIELDRHIGRTDPAWQRWFVATMVDFVVWTERPTGIIGEDAASWLAGALNGGGNTRASKTARLIVREVAEEAHAFENDALTILGTSFMKVRQSAPQVEAAQLAA